ncbi:MAG: hypothetical protein HY247_07320 [archaeon]|nr:MAG: hypothetical protein HY247_07320 [archaeon]
MKVIRLRQIITHKSPTRREIVDEYTLLNDGDQEQTHVIVEAYAYKANLHIYDSNAGELALYTNDLVKEYLRKQDDSLASELVNSIETHSKYVQWIILPKDRAIGVGETRIIRFSYADGKQAFSRITRTIFSLPIFKVAKTVSPSDTYMSHFTIIPPEGFEISVGKRSVVEMMPDGQKIPLGDSHRYHETVGVELLEFALPIRQNTVDFETSYSIIPERAERDLLRFFFYGLYFLSVGLSALALEISPASVTKEVANAFTVLDASIFAVCIGFIGLVTNPLTHRMKFAMVLPMTVSALTALIIALKG